MVDCGRVVLRFILTVIGTYSGSGMPSRAASAVVLHALPAPLFTGGASGVYYLDEMDLRCLKTKNGRYVSDKIVVGITSFASAAAILVPCMHQTVIACARVMLGMLCTCHLRATTQGPVCMHRAISIAILQSSSLLVQAKIFLRRYNAEGVGVAHSTSPALHADDGSTLLEDTELDRVHDAPLQAAVNILLPWRSLEVRLFLWEVEGVYTTVQVRVS
jgi:hypothetical protein